MPRLQTDRKIQVSATMPTELVARINAAVDGRSRSQWLCEAAEQKLGKLYEALDELENALSGSDGHVYVSELKSAKAKK